VSVKKSSLFDERSEEFGRFWRTQTIFSFFSSAAALFGSFFQLKGKRISPSGLRTVKKGNAMKLNF
jgi:hypothetical protein